MRYLPLAALCCAAVLTAGTTALAAPAGTAGPASPASFTVVPSPNGTNSEENLLSGVAVVSPRDAWAAGTAQTRGQNAYHVLMEHWNGTAWKIVRQQVGGIDSTLGSVSAVSATDIWAVGQRVTNHAVFATLTEHWNGKTWARVASPTFTADNAQDTLASVQALGPADVWAVGSYTPLDRATRTLAEHWDGSRWQVVKTADPAAGSNALDAVAGSGPGQPLWAVGTGTSGGTPQTTTLIQITTG